jgi:hypothetical protein
MRPDEDRDDYDDDTESQEIDYGDEDLNEEDALDEEAITEMDIFGDISDMIDDTGDPCCRPTTSQNEEEEARTDIDFSLLKGDELLLPYSYIVSERDQWKYVLDACESGFRSVKDLGKVSDKVLSLVADVAALVLERGGGTSTNERFVQYAEQRGV